MVRRRGSGCTLHIRMCHHLMSHGSASYCYCYCYYCFYCYCYNGVDANDVCMSILNSRDKLALSKLSNIKEDAALRAAFRKDSSPSQRRFSMNIVLDHISCISREGYNFRLTLEVELLCFNVFSYKMSNNYKQRARMSFTEQNIIRHSFSGTLTF